MMSEEKNSGAIVQGTGVVVVEQSATSRHKQPYRPTELHKESSADPQHKRTKAPAVPSVAEELKDSTDPPDMKEQMESDRAISSENFKQKVAKTLSSNIKKRGSSPETITLAPIHTETKKGPTTGTPQPIPAGVPSATDQVSEKVALQKREEEESIIEEVEDVRTSDEAKPSSEWSCNENGNEKKEISWTEKDKIPPKDFKGHTLLERKASVGPCFRSKSSLGVPSGISLCIPKKSDRILRDAVVNMPSVINISVSKKCLSTKSRFTLDCDRKGAMGEGSNRIKKCLVEKSKESKQKDNMEQGSRETQVDDPNVNQVGYLKGKINTMALKIRSVLKI